MKFPARFDSWNPFQEWYRGWNLAAMLLGWFIMGLVCSLGAPFWFDLLGKLVKMRGSGNRPEDGAKPAAGDGTQSPATTLARSAPDTVPPPSGEAMSDRMSDAEKALSQYEAERIQRVLQMPNEQVTGVFDAVTRASINKWQASRGYDASSILTRFQIDQLLGNQDQAEGEGYVG